MFKNPIQFTRVIFSLLVIFLIIPSFACSAPFGKNEINDIAEQVLKAMLKSDNNALLDKVIPADMRRLCPDEQRIWSDLTQSARSKEKTHISETTYADFAGRPKSIPKGNPPIVGTIENDLVPLLENARKGCIVSLGWKGPDVDCQWNFYRGRSFPACPIEGYVYVMLPVKHPDGASGALIMRVAFAKGRWFLGEKRPELYRIKGSQPAPAGGINLPDEDRGLELNVVPAPPVKKK